VTPSPGQAGSAVLAGATGQVGEGIAQFLLSQGWCVTAIGRSRSRLDDLSARLGHPAGLLTAVATVTRTGCTLPAGAAGGHALAVASLGGWYSGPPLTTLPIGDWHRIVDDGLTSHLLAARAHLPGIEAAGGGTYVMLNGTSARAPVRGHQCPGPAPSASSRQPQLMPADALAAEARSATVRSLLLNTPVPTRARPHGPPGWISASDVGRAVLALHREHGEQTTVTLRPAAASPP